MSDAFDEADAAESAQCHNSHWLANQVLRLCKTQILQPSRSSIFLSFSAYFDLL